MNRSGAKCLAILAALLNLSRMPAIAQPTISLRYSHEIQVLNGELPEKSSLRALAVNPLYEIFLADEGLNRILKLDSLGRLVKEIGGFGWENEQFDQPVDIWANNSLDVYVADYNNSRIQRFDRKLNFVGALANDPNLDPALQFAFPVAVALSRFSELFILGADNKRVLRFDKDGRPAQSFGDFDWGAGTLQEPAGLWVSANDEILVADAGRGAILRFDYYGNFLQEITHAGLRKPGSVLASAGFIFAVDAASEQIFIFRSSGEYLVHFRAIPPQAKKSAAASNSSGLDLALIENNLFVLQSSTNRIHCYHIVNNSR